MSACGKGPAVRTDDAERDVEQLGALVQFDGRVVRHLGRYGGPNLLTVERLDSE
jgi:hypothetical protein